MRVIESAADSEYYASKVKDSGGVIVVPAFQGLGAPYWDPYARGMIIGLTRASTKYHIIRATIESMAYQTADVIDLMEKNASVKVSELAVDGGASANNLLLSFQADILGIPILRPECIETTALGAAYLAGLATGFFKSTDDIKNNKAVAKRFEPTVNRIWANEMINGWNDALRRTLI